MTNVFCAGIDVGTSYVKAVVVDSEGAIVGLAVERTGANLHGSIVRCFQEVIAAADIPREAVRYVMSSGFGRRNVDFADGSRTEITSHARGAYHHFPREITVVDIGGQDTKVIRLDADGRRVGFRMNRKCAAGTGAFLEEIALKLDIPVHDMNAMAERSTSERTLNSYCTVFASSEILTRIRDGERVEDMVRSAFEAVARRVIEMDTLEGTVVLTGGVVAHNPMVRDILAARTGADVVVPPDPQYVGAHGAALLAMEAFHRGGVPDDGDADG
ncbi:MAG: acyl-CoA dehydratase activase [Thermoplasmata archaeon]|nr:acyl-CoA dehydratase activase [Thermoplasmata archaeon]